MANICEEKHLDLLTRTFRGAYPQERATLMFSRSPYALSLAPLGGYSLTSPLSGFEGHVAFGILAAGGVIGVARMLLALMREAREYRNGE
jgi:hypothetical protein